jgi:hypothetical protein
LKKPLSHYIKPLLGSKAALALPVTFLILLVSTLGIVAVTYYYSVERITAQGNTLKVSTAKQNLLNLNDAVISTFWQPGSSATCEVADSGGQLHLEPTNNTLTICINAESELNATVYNASIGRVIYELPYTSTIDTGLYLKGDSRTIANQSGSSMAQLQIANGQQRVEIQLRYRPSITYVATGEENGRAVNNIRIYIVNLNTSDNFALFGILPLQARCQNTQLTTHSYEVSSNIHALNVTSILDGQVGGVSVPITRSSNGSVINIETVICNIAIERWIR